MGTQICEKPALLLKVMGHPLRLKILQKINYDENCNQFCLMHEFNVPQSTLATQLSKLVKYGIIECSNIGHNVSYRLINDDVRRVIQSINL